MPEKYIITLIQIFESKFFYSTASGFPCDSSGQIDKDILKNNKFVKYDRDNLIFDT